MRLFHGSDQVIERPIVSANTGFADLGHGFYLTDNRDVAVARAKSRARAMGAKTGFVSEFAFDLSALSWVSWGEGAPAPAGEPFALCFEPDAQGIAGWAAYVKACRAGKTSLDGIGDPAVTRAWIATEEIEMVCSGWVSAEDMAALIDPAELTVQYCFRAQEAIDKHLAFMSAFEV